MTLSASKTYEHLPQTAPNPAGFCVSYSPNKSAVFARSSRWIMITDTSAKIVNLRLAGVANSPASPLVGVSGDVSMAANGVLSSTTSSKFSTLNAGDPVTISGFTNMQNNGLFVVGPSPTGTSLTLMVPGTMKITGSTLSGGTPADTVAETPAGAAASIQGPPISAQDTISFTALAGVMYPICADMLLATTTTAAGVLAFY